jgi:hypothetical protein
MEMKIKQLTNKNQNDRRRESERRRTRRRRRRSEQKANPLETSELETHDIYLCFLPAFSVLFCMTPPEFSQLGKCWTSCSFWLG